MAVSSERNAFKRSKRASKSSYPMPTALLIASLSIMWVLKKSHKMRFSKLWENLLLINVCRAIMGQYLLMGRQVPERPIQSKEEVVTPQIRLREIREVYYQDALNTFFERFIKFRICIKILQEEMVRNQQDLVLSYLELMILLLTSRLISDAPT
jgi:hypothetical protein